MEPAVGGDRKSTRTGSKDIVIVIVGLDGYAALAKATTLLRLEDWQTTARVCKEGPRRVRNGWPVCRNGVMTARGNGFKTVHGPGHNGAGLPWVASKPEANQSISIGILPSIAGCQAWDRGLTRCEKRRTAATRPCMALGCNRVKRLLQGSSRYG